MVVERYREFLLDIEKPFRQRAARHLGLHAEEDPTTLPVHRFTRLGPAHGQAIYYAVVTLESARPPLYQATMSTTLDSSIVCIKRSDIAALGPIYPGWPIIVHSAGGGIARIEPTPEHISMTTSRGPIEILLKGFKRDCVSEIEHAVQIVKE